MKTLYNDIAEPRRILTRDECEDIATRLGKLSRGGETTALVLSFWNGELRWARNRVALSSDRRDVFVSIERRMRGVGASVVLNQLDDVSLRAAVSEAERMLSFRSPGFENMRVANPPFEYLRTTVWSDATYNLTANARGEVARALTTSAEAQGLLSAGYLETRAQAGAVIRHVDGQTSTLYATCTQAQCSMTVRDVQGTASGWAGLSSYDWTKLDGPVLAERALQKCLTSRNPLRIEPGRFTVILEPQAVHDLVSPLMNLISRETPESGFTSPFLLGRDTTTGLYRSKLGLKIMDDRITIDHDPSDPMLGVIPASTTGLIGEPYRAVTWVTRGVLTALSHGRGHALRTRSDNFGSPNSGSFRMSGGTVSVDEMMATMSRGLIVSRLRNVMLLDQRSALSTGLTSDGVWLVEGGKITRAVKNFRFTESSLFALNNVEQLGVPVPVFRPVTSPYIPGVTPAIVPALKIRDFNFSSLSDAV